MALGIEADCLCAEPILHCGRATFRSDLQELKRQESGILLPNMR